MEGNYEIRNPFDWDTAGDTHTTETNKYSNMVAPIIPVVDVGRLSAKKFYDMQVLEVIKVKRS